MLKFKEGVVTKGLQPEMLKALRVAHDTKVLLGGNNAVLTVTSALDGIHKRHSAHENGLAIDVRIRDFTNRREVVTFASLLMTELDTDYDVIVEDDHIHIEFDPKIGGVSWLAISRGLLSEKEFTE